VEPANRFAKDRYRLNKARGCVPHVTKSRDAKTDEKQLKFD